MNVSKLDEKRLAALARAAERQMSEVNVQFKPQAYQHGMVICNVCNGEPIGGEAVSWCWRSSG